ncbi:MAG: hypothetical protein WCH76_08310, partial [Candidatus Riflemargulisbacteria bacterium]
MEAVIEMEIILVKTCSKCGIEKPLTEFYKQKAGKFGVTSKCKCCIISRQSIYNAKHKEEKAAKNAIWYAKHAEELAAKKATPEAKAIKNARKKERMATDPLYKLEHNTRCLIANAVKNGGYKKNTKTHNILSCSYEEFQIHIENQFQPNMTWQNAGEWHIDHFFPVSWATNEEQFYKLNHYSNLRPLWATDNQFKKA